jgi:hypothetical protein
MSQDSHGWAGTRPDYLLDRAGEVYGWVPNKGEWAPTGEFYHDAAEMLRQRVTSAPVAWSAGHPLYEDPRPRMSYIPIPRPPEIPRVDGLAKTARVFSFLGFLFSPFAIVGLILGYKALTRIRNDDAESRSVAWTAIVVGWIVTGLALLLVLLIVAHK